jgi:MIP family channel proteins
MNEQRTPNRANLKPETKRMIAALVGELLGTMFLVFIAAGIQANEQSRQNEITDNNADLRMSSSYILTMALGYGLTYTSISVAFVRVSGAHFNPAISIAAIVGKRIPFGLGIFYVFAQMTGAACGSAMFDGLSGEKDLGKLGVARVATDFDTGRIFGIELVATTFIVYVWHSVMNPRRSIPHVSFRSETGPLYVGLAYFVCILLTFRWDGSGLNPVRAFGPSLVANEWKHWWVYWLGPLMGGLAGVLLFELLAFLAPARSDVAKISPSY